MQFNVVGNASLQVKQGYLGLAIQYRGKSQTIPFVNETNDLEYRLASAIRVADSRDTKPVIGLFSGDVGAGGRRRRRCSSELGEIVPRDRTFSLSDTTQPAPAMQTLVSDRRARLAAQPARARLAAFFNRGGSALVMTSGMLPNRPDADGGRRIRVGWNSVLARFGVSMPSDMVYDLAANEIMPAAVRRGARCWRGIRSSCTRRAPGASVVNQEVNDVLLAWASSIDTTAAKGTRSRRCS